MLKGKYFTVSNKYDPDFDSYICIGEVDDCWIMAKDNLSNTEYYSILKEIGLKAGSRLDTLQSFIGVFDFIE